MQSGTTLGARVRRFFTLMGVIGAMTAAVLVTQRLSAETLALLLGLGCGVVVVLPLFFFMAWYIRRQQEVRPHDRQRTADPSPPVVVLMPPVPPGYEMQRPALWKELSSEREFKIVGEE